MSPAVQSMIAATYVRDIDASRAFYELLGFREQSAGKAETSAWSALQHNGLSVLLASTRPPLDLPRLPLLFYFYLDDLDAVAVALGTASVEVTEAGHPPHALGGEVKILDPDGNTVLLGQLERSASQPPAADDTGIAGFLSQRRPAGGNS
jgi:catechol 2,3-dioxygenase-like lactoylglutathione lyase family enzyme